MMKKVIETLFHTKTYTIEKMDKGLTNHNYLLYIHNQKYVVRVPDINNPHICDRFLEKKISNTAKMLDVDTLYFDEHSGIKITRYVEDVYEYENCPYPDKIERCAKLMKKLHQLPLCHHEYNAIETLRYYQSHIQNPIYSFKEYEDKIKEINSFHNQKTLCHNDFVSGNILFHEKRDYLIDYEYSSDNDPLFDVISFLSENQIYDPKLRIRFYHAYFNQVDTIIFKQMYLWELFQNILWCNWAMMMHEAKGENIYQEIAREKYQALLQLDTLYKNIWHIMKQEENNAHL